MLISPSPAPSSPHEAEKQHDLRPVKFQNHRSRISPGRELVRVREFFSISTIHRSQNLASPMQALSVSQGSLSSKAGPPHLWLTRQDTWASHFLPANLGVLSCQTCCSEGLVMAPP